ncbi:putative basic proline-rich protein-like [Iris pallida]|uniref:Basic proline-rich protein-like n=1 Tax=Iris pallida TaxID=29817 RepID=A0AAX6DNM7_IRIPA|nr:putative basic proline-rich protein-like [Iris pallida]
MDLYMRCYPPREHRVHCACAFHLHRVLLCFHLHVHSGELCTLRFTEPPCILSRAPYMGPHVILYNNITCIDPCVLIGVRGSRIGHVNNTPVVSYQNLILSVLSESPMPFICPYCTLTH